MPHTSQHEPSEVGALLALTRREREVGQMLGQRLNNREISEQLVISVRTAECHVGSVIAKLGAANRREGGLLLRSCRTVVTKKP